MHRKGFADLAALLLGIVIGAIVLTIAWNAGTFFKKGGDLQACRLSVETAAASRGTPLFESRRQCTAVLDEELKNIEDKKEAMDKIADHLWECWWANGEGELNAFQGRGTQKDAHCFVCAQFELNKKFREDVAITNADLLVYVQGAKYKTKPESAGRFIREGVIRANNRELLLAESVLLPKDSSTIERIISTVFAPAEPINVGGLQAEMAALVNLWQIWFSEAKVKPLEALEYSPDDPYVVVFYQVSKEALTQTWESRLLAEKLESETLQEAVAVPPAKIFITKLSKVGDSNCEMIQG